MNKTGYTMMIAALLLAMPPLALAADKCPAELSEAKAMLKKATASAPPRQLAGARKQDVQAPRTPSQDVQAPRTPSQDVQAPRSSQDVQAPRTPSQDVQAPRTQAAAKTSPEDKARLDKVRKLISESEAACKKGDMALSTSKATEAMGLMK